MMTAKCWPGRSNWDSNDEPPAIYVMPPKEGSALGAGDRLLARLEKRGESYEATHRPPAGSEAETRLHRRAAREPRTACGVMPVERKARGEYALDKRDAGRRQKQ